jgi:hypothetical protein
MEWKYRGKALFACQKKESISGSYQGNRIKIIRFHPENVWLSEKLN